MVWIKNVGMKPCYICDGCGLGYKDAKTALLCQEYCRKHNSCSVNIAKRAIYHP